MNSNTITVREAPLEEAVKVNNTITEFGEPYAQSYFEKRIASRISLIIVAYVDEKPAGYIIGYDKYDDSSFYCWMAGVNPRYRGIGVLKALMNYQEKWAKEKGYTKIKIKTRNNRREMLSYLIKYGFNFIEVEKQPDRDENRILLEKDIFQR